jgi:hypothetical protein
MSEPVVTESEQAVAAAKPKRKKARRKRSPNALTKDLGVRLGWSVAVVEQRLPHTFITRDLFNVIDLVALDGLPGMIGIQATSDDGGGHSGARMEKISASAEAVRWLRAGLRIEVWAWKRYAEPSSSAIVDKSTGDAWDVVRMAASLEDNEIVWDDVES